MILKYIIMQYDEKDVTYHDESVFDYQPIFVSYDSAEAIAKLELMRRSETKTRWFACHVEEEK
ncbi:hypothetical protein OLCHANIL_00120 [Vibrio phage V05]|nr:hypothetical protein OLCHANIL_00120 [Vibrio phage V05]QIW91205.1 hypothetical protein COHAPHLL_00369 [Vibrio phage V09]UNA01724.1 hypothetical protein [Vibrio phage PC-Liy1]URQ03020.1 hypothetical protein PVA8_34 [Vibrio phage PVA8]WBM58756.1 hypothetical protein vBValMPVA8_34 [Vibrio phage vB_ValM_PVA8]WOL24741.1 hypothetical protein [Vibrio phage PG216]